MKGRICGALLFFSGLLAGCQAVHQIQNQSPAAQQPFELQVQATLGGDHWVGVGASPQDGSFAVLPLDANNPTLELFFRAPWPSSVEITADGTLLKSRDSLPPGTDVHVTGFYTIKSVNDAARDATPLWDVIVAAPSSAWGKNRFAVQLVDVSINPQYAGTPNGRSSALVANMTAPASFRLNVSRTGSGTVTDNLNGINCGSNCSHDYGQSTTVRLSATPAAGSVFAGWSGSCSGGTPSCSLTLNGTALSAAAAFRESDYQPGNFVGVQGGNACGFTVAPDSNRNNIVFSKPGSNVPSLPIRGNGNWNVFFSSSCEAAVIVEKGVNSGLAEQLTLVALKDNSTPPTVVTAGHFDRILQSPDGRVLAISREQTINPAIWFQDYLKAGGEHIGSQTATSLDANRCAPNNPSNIWLTMKPQNVAEASCPQNTMTPTISIPMHL